jgi:hypothetical protein
VARVVHRLVGHAARQRAVADHGNRIAMAGVAIAAKLTGQGKAKRGGYTCRRMRGTERVVGGLGALGETRQAVLLPDRQHLVAATGQDLVGVALVADVPDQLVAGGVEGRVDRDGHLHHAEARAEMAAGLADGPDGLGPQFMGQPFEVRVRQTLEVGG